MSLREEKTILPWLCCQIPGVCTASMIAILCSAAVCEPTVFVVLAAALSIYVCGWTINMSVFSSVGAWRMRRDSDRDWHGELLKLHDEDPNSFDTIHFVIVPNYMEDESTMKETLVNLGRSPMAQHRIRIILAMELREGPGVQEKAKRLISSTSHLFADISATFHPAGLPGEVPGKSSNEQWAFRHIMRSYDSELKKTFDPSRVFLTVIDADSILHPRYFSALALQGMTMSKESRVWKIWQPPVLLLRNLFSVPGVTRVSGLGTILFELAGLANQSIGSHIAFSSYSLTLALASHKVVAGWDPDVIAEDHHMFVKCYFAPLWEAALRPFDHNSTDAVKPKVELEPIYLPALCYMAESAHQEYWSSVAVRFLQARRHAQGVAELAYSLLQYIRLCMTVGFFSIPLVTHRGITCIIWKMFTVHITNVVQATSLVLGVLAIVPKAVLWALGGGLSTFLAGGAGFFASVGATDVAWYAMVCTLGPLPPVMMLASFTTFVVVQDVLDGRHDVGQARLIQNNPAQPRLSLWQKISLLAWNQREIMTLGEPTVLLFGMVPELMAIWSLIWRGTAFQYLVAPKPLTRVQH